MSRQRRRGIYPALKEAYAIKDKDLDAQNVRRTQYYRDYLYRLFLGRVKITCPLWWNLDYVRDCLFFGGGFAITESDKYAGAAVPYAFTVEQVNAWTYPTLIRSNDEVDIGERVVGVDTEIVTMGAAYGVYRTGWAAGSLHEMIELYAQKLALCDGSIDTNLMVSRTPFLGEAEDKADSDKLREIFTQVMAGKPAVFYRKRSMPGERSSSPFTRLPVKENYIANTVQDAKHDIINEYLTAIGIQNSNTDKRERLITSEVEANNAETDISANLWRYNIDRSLARVRAMFPRLDFNIEFVRGGGGGETNNDTVRSDGDLQYES